MRVVVLCRGSVEGGLGHLYRAASFASVCEKRVSTRVFAIADMSYERIFSDLATRPVFGKEEREVIDALCATSPDVIVTDLTELSDASFGMLRVAAEVIASISPVFNQASRVDQFFTRGHVPKDLVGPKIFSGLSYAILNSRCHPISDDKFENAVSSATFPIMVSFGGGDAENHTRRVLDTLRDVEAPLLIWAMLGGAYPHSHDELIESVRAAPNHEIVVARADRSMWSVASNCALAVLSSGLSTLEAIYAGLPIISVRRSNDPANQVSTAYDKLCINGGSFTDESYRRLGRIVERLANDRVALREMRHLQQGLLDGRGADRVVSRILAEASSNVDGALRCIG